MKSVWLRQKRARTRLVDEFWQSTSRLLPIIGGNFALALRRPRLVADGDWRIHFILKRFEYGRVIWAMRVTANVWHFGMARSRTIERVLTLKITFIAMKQVTWI